MTQPTPDKGNELVASDTPIDQTIDDTIRSQPQDEQTVRGLSPAKVDASLTAEQERIDPTADGWQTESFNESALAQLKKLGAWLEAGATETAPDILPTNARSTELRPEELTSVFADSGITVLRWEENKSTNVEQGDAIEKLRTLVAGASDIHFEFKIIGIDQPSESESSISTRIRIHASAKNADGQLQQNAAWICRWVNTQTAQPKLAAIELLEFEEVRSRAKKLFADRTAAVFQGEPCYANQLARPLDYWRDRIDWRFGWLVVGPHGLAVGDANGDGLDDLYVAETGGLPNRLLIQQPDGSVRDASHDAGVDIIEPTQSALFLDLDNDGDQDLLASVSRFILVFENDGSGKFKQHPILQTGSMLRSFAAADYDNDGLLDLYACGYSLRDTGDSVGLGRPLPYHDANNGAPSYLLKNDGNFRFEDVTKSVGLDENNTRFSYAAAWEDFDNDGDLDLYVANDFGRNNLYRNDDGTFKDVAPEAGVEDVAAGMSVSWGDYNQDGLPDIYIGNMFSSAGNRIAYQRQFRTDIDDETRAMYQRHARGNSLFENVGDGTFRDVSQKAGVTEARWAWGSNFADINNDGWQDLVVANGMVTGTEDSGDL